MLVFTVIFCFNFYHRWVLLCDADWKVFVLFGWAEHTCQTTRVCRYEQHLQQMFACLLWPCVYMGEKCYSRNTVRSQPDRYKHWPSTGCCTLMEEQWSNVLSAHYETLKLKLISSKLNHTGAQILHCVHAAGETTKRSSERQRKNECGWANSRTETNRFKDDSVGRRGLTSEAEEWKIWLCYSRRG